MKLRTATRASVTITITITLAALALAGCDKQQGEEAATAEPTTAEAGEAGGVPAGEPAKALKTDKGVNTDKKTIRVGALNDESGPAAAIGKPFALGKRLAVAVVNAGGVLPEGWQLELVEKDHGYNPQKSVAGYNEIKDEILYVANSFGTPNTLPLRPMLQRDGMTAFPASLSSKMAEDKHTPPLGPSYEVEAMRAMDFAVEQAGGADKVKAGIVYQQDDYGQDGLDGWKAAAGKHGVMVVSEAAIAPTQKDFAAVIAALKDKGANYVLLATLPSATGPILGAAAQLQFMPVWIGNTASWIDAFFLPKVIPSAVFANFYWMSGLPYWGEDVKGMDTFVKAFEQHAEDAKPDFYVLVSYIQGLAAAEAVKRAIEAGDLTRAGFAKALTTIAGWDAGGLIQPIDLSKFPYQVSTQTRVLKPDFAKSSWTVAAPYAAPKALSE